MIKLSYKQIILLALGLFLLLASIILIAGTMKTWTNLHSPINLMMGWSAMFVIGIICLHYFKEEIKRNAI